METPLPNRIHSLGPRIPVYLEPRAPSTVVGMETPSRIAPRDSTETCTSENAHQCEKPYSQKRLAVPIALGIIIPVVAIIGVLFWLHRRNVKKVRREDKDPTNELDFGLGDKPSAVNSLRKSIFGEKGTHKQQLSMDLDLSTPYLLPPQAHGSRESLHSLAHSIQTSEDPYRNQFNGSEVGSLRSVHRGPGGGGDQSSLYTASTRSGPARDMMSPTRLNFPRPPPATADPYQRRPPPASLHAPQSPHSPLSSSEFNLDLFSAPPGAYAQSTPYPEEKAAPAQSNRTELPVLDMPSLSDAALFPQDAQDTQGPPSSNFPTPMSAAIETAPPADHHLASHPEPQQAQMGHVRHYSMDEYTTPAQAPHPQRTASHEQSEPAVMPVMGRESYYSDDNTHHNYLQGDAAGPEEDDGRGRRTTRFLDGEAARGSQFLAAPQSEERRLSVGLRPLPPDEVTDTEDPEHRANRIRSFYKEYFEVDPSSHPPLPTSTPVDPTQREGPRHPPPQGQGAGYYEDYDDSYLGNTYIDPASNSFVMPYAQPVHRRAMTPPPRGNRMRGPQPPRNFHGSMGGMSLPGGRGPFRPGSAASSRFGPRPDSSASARPGARGRPLPPPEALTTLPNPAKLGDDTFALMSAMDFAPPDSHKDRVAGRSQSPVPEKRAYHLGVPIHSPLASSYDDLAVIPSPHSLRKSSTFTGLDFALPKRFKDDGDAMSDAGSIKSSRSNKSGISAMNQAALRSGAGRVSRLPGDTVFSQAQLADQLKPNWGMRT